MGKHRQKIIKLATVPPAKLKFSALDAETKLFVQLVVVLGIAQNEAYLTAFRLSNANNSSASALASRLMRDEWVVRYKDFLINSYFGQTYILPKNLTN